jgi:hypothetical protein
MATPSIEEGEMARKRRRRERGRSEQPEGVVPAATQRADGRPRVLARDVGMPEWRWRTFPVLAAVSAGLVLGSTFPILFIAGLLGVSYAVAHLFVTNIVVAGRIRRREKELAMARQMGVSDDDEGDEVEWEDAVVHPDEEPAEERR